MNVVVYTALIGGCDRLKPAPTGARCVCFTDDLTLSSSRARGWETRWAPSPASPRLAARLLKARSDRLFPEADVTVWVDASCELHDFTALLTDAGDHEIAGMEHPWRHNVWDEAAEVIRLQQQPEAVVNQVHDYRASGFVSDQLTTTGLLVRRHTPRITTFNYLWENQIEAYGLNDQLDADHCAWRAGLCIARLRGHYLKNPYARYDVKDHHRRRQPYGPANA